MILRILSVAVAIGIVVFVVWRGADAFPRVDLSAPETWLWLGAALGLYTVSQILGALAWREVLASHGTILPPGRAESQLLLSQIGKYLPGNVGHFVGRYALGRQDGVPGAQIGSALTVEVGVVLSAAALVSTGLLLVLPSFRDALAAAVGEAALGPLTFLTPLALIAGLVVLQMVLWRRAGRPKIRMMRLALPGLLYVLNFALLGVSLWCVAYAVPTAGGVDLLTATAIFSVAWAVGFIMPGTPGGIGIRDGIVAIGLGLFMGEGAALAAALAHRLLSGLGDSITFFCGLALRSITRRPDISP